MKDNTMHNDVPWDFIELHTIDGKSIYFRIRDIKTWGIYGNATIVDIYDNSIGIIREKAVQETPLDIKLKIDEVYPPDTFERMIKLLGE